MKQESLIQDNRISCCPGLKPICAISRHPILHKGVQLLRTTHKRILLRLVVLHHVLLLQVLQLLHQLLLVPVTEQRDVGGVVHGQHGLSDLLREDEHTPLVLVFAAFGWGGLGVFWA
jgi:hypothetical protein